jgi:hypothetical protein
MKKYQSVAWKGKGYDAKAASGAIDSQPRQTPSPFPARSIPREHEHHMPASISNGSAQTKRALKRTPFLILVDLRCFPLARACSIYYNVMRAAPDGPDRPMLVKSSLKETVCQNFTVIIPALVKHEIVEDGRGHPDAAIVRGNLERKLLADSKRPTAAAKGEEEVFSEFQSGDYDAICSDDKRFLKRMRLLQVPYLTPAVLIAVLVKNGKLAVPEALHKLESLSPMISDEEYATVKLFLQGWRPE